MADDRGLGKKRVSDKPLVRYPPVGSCIYCGRTNPAPLQRFTDEHVLPLGFGGTMVLPEASCMRCQRIINKEIEAPILSGDWGYFREKYRLPSRGKSARTHVTVRSVNGRNIKIPVDDFPGIAPIWRLGTARLLSQTDQEQGRQPLIIGDSKGDEDSACKIAYPEWGGTYSMRVRYDAFARLLAKIAYGFVVASQGTGWLRESITPIILGEAEDFSTHVGGSLDGWDHPEGEEVTNPIMMVRGNGGGMGTVIFVGQFLAGVKASKYHVVLGECDVAIGDDQKTVTFNADREVPSRSVQIERTMTAPEVITKS